MFIPQADISIAEPIDVQIDELGNSIIHMLRGPWKLSGRFRCVSVIHVSAMFLLRFRYVSVNVSVAFPSTFPLRFRWAIACPTNAALKLLQRQQNQQ